MFRRKRKVVLDEEQAAEFYRRLDAYNAAIAQLPAVYSRAWVGIGAGDYSSALGLLTTFVF